MKLAQGLSHHLKLGDQIGRASLISMTVWVVAFMGSEGKPSPPPIETGPASSVVVNAKPGGPVIIKTLYAEFDVLTSGYIQAYLLNDGSNSTLDEPLVASQPGSDSLFSAGKEIHFVLGSEAKVSETHGNMGARGKSVELKA